LKPIEEQGYLIPAFNFGKVDYVDCANTLALSIKSWHPESKICLLTNTQVNLDVFDYVRTITADEKNPYSNDWQVFYQTPFRETIKIEADMLITSGIDHWWTMLRHRDVVISTGARTWQDQTATSRAYRRVFDENHLPDVYNAITYWRLSHTAKNFFDTVRHIFENWDQYQKMIRFPESTPSTDLVYAMAAEIVGSELVTLPFATYPRMVHMKPAHSGSQGTDWTKEFVWEYHESSLRINTIAQWGAFHYHVKHWRPD
jgi:hypothetical protein